jgi:hypothetical protein
VKATRSRVAAAVFFAGCAAWADAPLREMRTDRPSRTSTPFTVYAGHTQIESDLVKRSEREVRYLSTEFRLGITDWMDTDLQVERNIEPRIEFRFNLMGNSGGPIAFGMIPFVRTEKNLPGGIQFPFNLELGPGWQLGLMAEVDREANSSDEAFHPEFVSSFVLKRELSPILSIYAEYYNRTFRDPDTQWEATFDAGVEAKLTASFELYAAVNVGLTDGTEPTEPILGAAYRF